MRLAGRQAGFYKKSQAEDSFGLRKNPGSLQTNSPMHLLDKLEYGTTASYLKTILHSPFEENQIKSNLKLCILLSYVLIEKQKLEIFEQMCAMRKICLLSARTSKALPLTSSCACGASDRLGLLG